MALPPLISRLRLSVGTKNVLHAPSEVAVYADDPARIGRRRPDAVVFPESPRQVAEIVRACCEYGVHVMARGAGTALPGGCVALGGGVVVVLTRMNRILEVDLPNRMAVVEAGVSAAQLARRLAETGYEYAPDPYGHGASTLGGEVATSAVGRHALRHGLGAATAVGLEVVLADGSIVQLGPVEDPTSFDLLGVLAGSDGTLGIVTKAWLRLTAEPKDPRVLRAVFDSLESAATAVGRIVAAGLMPVVMELIDQGLLAAVENAFECGFPPDAAAILLIEIQGPPVGLDAQQERIGALCREMGAREVLPTASDEVREMLWKCRKQALGTVGRLSPNCLIHDGAVPWSRLSELFRRIAQIGARHGIRIVHLAHAADGGIHPILLFDRRDPRQAGRAAAASREILEACIACGGGMTAGYGVGIEKAALMPRLRGPEDMEAMRNVRGAFDPVGWLSAGKRIASAENRS